MPTILEAIYASMKCGGVREIDTVLGSNGTPEILPLDWIAFFVVSGLETNIRPC